MRDNEFGPPTLSTVRPVSKRGWVKATTDLPPDLMAALDQKRGNKSRSQYLFELVEANLPSAA